MASCLFGSSQISAHHTPSLKEPSLLREKSSAASMEAGKAVSEAGGEQPVLQSGQKPTSLAAPAMGLGRDNTSKLAPANTFTQQPNSPTNQLMSPRTLGRGIRPPLWLRLLYEVMLLAFTRYRVEIDVESTAVNSYGTVPDEMLANPNLQVCTGHRRKAAGCDQADGPCTDDVTAVGCCRVIAV